MPRVDPNLWQIPSWHPDGDGEFQFGALGAFARALHATSDLGAQLSIIEEGYARLEIFEGARKIGLVYVNRAEDRSIPLFSVYAGESDSELTTTYMFEGIQFLGDNRTVFPAE